MPQTKNAKRIGAMDRMNSAIRRYRVKIESLSRLQAQPLSDNATLRQYDVDTNGRREELKQMFERKIQTLDRDIRFTRAKMGHDNYYQVGI